MNEQIDPKERYEASIYTERGGCVRMAFFDTATKAQSWLRKQLETVRTNLPHECAWAVRDRHDGKVLVKDGPDYLRTRKQE